MTKTSTIMMVSQFFVKDFGYNESEIRNIAFRTFFYSYFADEYFADIAIAYQEEFRDLYASGCRKCLARNQAIILTNNYVTQAIFNSTTLSSPTSVPSP